MANVSPILLAHFWSKADVRSTGCWPWLGELNEFGYGVFHPGKSLDMGRGAHRFAYTAVKGDIPDGLMVRHLCGNKPCVNPDHLEVGTMKDNAADGLALGERRYGSRNHKTKLTEEQTLYVFRNPDGLRNRDLALMFGVSPATISLIQKGSRRQAVTQDEAHDACRISERNAA